MSNESNARLMAGTFVLQTIGCKINQYDGQVLRERLHDLGWRETAPGETADVCVVNTCTVTRRADEKCRKRVRRLLRKHPGACMIVTGCGATVSPEQFQAIPGVSAVLTREQTVHFAQFLSEDRVPPSSGDIFDRGIAGFAGHSRGFMKIQDGCSARCAYCIVPDARGAPRSRHLDDVRREAERLVDAGFVEIVLAGIHLGQYGLDLDGSMTLADAARAVLDLEGVKRLRLSSLDPAEVTEDLLEIAAEHTERFCPHFHLPLQSGDDEVLARMNRRYTAGEFLATLDRIRERLDNPSFTTDVMVGFPGETDAAFANTLAVCRRAKFSRIHIFPFSARAGTPAATMPDQVRSDILRERAHTLQEVVEALALAYKEPFIGADASPLTESRRDKETGLLTGWTPRYMRVLYDGPDEVMGRIVRVRVTGATPRALRGELMHDLAIDEEEKVFR